MQRIKLAGIDLPTHVSGEVQVALKRAIGESFVSSFRLVSLICAGLALASALSAWRLVEGKKPERAGRIARESQAPPVGVDKQEPQISAN